MELRRKESRRPVSVSFRGRGYRFRNVRDLYRDVFGHQLPGYHEEQELLNAVAAAAPEMVSDPGTPKVVTVANIKAFVRSFVSRWTGKMRTVSEEVAQDRLRTCLEGYAGEKCPRLAEFVECGHCNSIASALMGTPAMPKPDYSCNVCGCYVNVKVWMAREVLLADDRELEYPDHCWMHAACRDTPENG